MGIDVGALEDLLAEVRVEAELAVRTEYENTVIKLRQEVEDLMKARDMANNEWDKWRDAYNKMSADNEAFVDALKSVLYER